MAYKKVVKEEPIVEETVEEIVKTEVPEKVEAKEIKKYSGDDLIPCRSVTEGSLVCRVGKDGDMYEWSNYGDITEVTYSDLMSLRAKKSPFIFDPLFVIEDEEVLEDPKWKNVREFYENMYAPEDVYDIINLPLAQFKKIFSSLPKGLVKAVLSQVSTQIENGTFDSLQKARFLDEVAGSDFSSII